MSHEEERSPIRQRRLGHQPIPGTGRSLAGDGGLPAYCFGLWPERWQVPASGHLGRVDYRHALPAVIPIAGLGLRKS